MTKIAFNNAQKRFITAKTTQPLQALLKSHLPQDANPETVLNSGGVWLNKKRLENPAQPIEKGQTLIVYISPLQGDVCTLDPQWIVADYQDFLVVNKPAGITSVADRSNTKLNMTHAVGQYFQSQGLRYWPSPIMRLDYLVSGLMLYPKHKRAEKELFKLMANRQIHKSYTADLEPSPDPVSCLRISDKLAFTNKARVSEEGKVCESLFMLQESTAAYNRYTVILLTGRRHQIRAHAAHYLSPILEDSLYGKGKASDPKPLALRADKLNFSYQGERFRFRL